MGPEQLFCGSSQTKSNRKTLGRSLNPKHLRHAVIQNFNLPRIQAMRLCHSITSSLILSSFN